MTKYEVVVTDPAIKKRKAELIKQYEGQLNDPVIIAKIEDELIAMDKAYMKGDNSLRFYEAQFDSKTFDIWRKKLYITVGGNGAAGAPELAKAITGVAGVSVNQIEDGLTELVVSVNGDAEIRPALIKKLVEGGCDLYEAALNKNSLEDVFHALTEAK